MCVHSIYHNGRQTSAAPQVGPQLPSAMPRPVSVGDPVGSRPGVLRKGPPPSPPARARPPGAAAPAAAASSSGHSKPPPASAAGTPRRLGGLSPSTRAKGGGGGGAGTEPPGRPQNAPPLRPKRRCRGRRRFRAGRGAEVVGRRGGRAAGVEYRTLVL
jgi:hypothetical protein